MSALPQSNVQRRDRAIWLTFSSWTGSKVCSVICTFAQVPIALKYLHAEAYGLWMTLVSVVTLLNVVDFGLGVGMQTAMAAAFGKNDQVRLRQTFWTGAAILGVFGLIIFALALPWVLFAPWANLFHISDPELRTQVGAAMGIALASFVFGLPFNAVARLTASIQRGWIHAGWIVAGSTTSLVMVILAAYFHLGFLAFLAAALLIPSLQMVGLWIQIFRFLGWSFKPTQTAPWIEVREILRSSALFAFPQIGMALVQSLPPLAISIAAGSAAVTGFNLLTRLFGTIQHVQSMYLTPIWPAYTEAHIVGDHRWIRRALVKSVLMSLAFCAGVGVIAWLSPFLISVWIRTPNSYPGNQIALITAVWIALQIAIQPSIFFLAGIGRLKELAWAATPGLFVGVAALFIGTRLRSVFGVLEIGSIALVVAVLPWLIRATIRAARHYPRD